MKYRDYINVELSLFSLFTCFNLSSLIFEFLQCGAEWLPIKLPVDFVFQYMWYSQVSHQGSEKRVLYSHKSSLSSFSANPVKKSWFHRNNYNPSNSVLELTVFVSPSSAVLSSILGLRGSTRSSPLRTSKCATQSPLVRQTGASVEFLNIIGTRWFWG